ncbi:hypothetical protein AMTR_s00055p00177340 [Amborella trichopoda]|uniref:Uncharacterized protein n=1 Tax=Amborella trichopoda TaxID=13333 RepID=U5DD14_AMBTC|nr:hypothetical protein AMTR_s00055p00177340 [Amborella trichopoda]
MARACINLQKTIVSHLLLFAGRPALAMGALLQRRRTPLPSLTKFLSLISNPSPGLAKRTQAPSNPVLNFEALWSRTMNPRSNPTPFPYLDDMAAPHQGGGTISQTRYR